MIAVVDYGIGNLRSAEKALLHLGADAALTSDVRAIETAVVESARILRAEPGQFRSQLLSRVPRAVAADVDALLDDAASWREMTWLRPHGAVRNHGYLASFGPMKGFAGALAVSDDASVLLDHHRYDRSDQHQLPPQVMCNLSVAL